MKNPCSYSICKSSKSVFWGYLPYFIFSNNRSIKVTFHYSYFLFEYYWCIEPYFTLYQLLLLFRYIIHQVLLFGVFVIIFSSLIVDLFVHIDRISVHWSRKLSLGVLSNFLWDVSKMYIRIYFPRRFVEGRVEGAGWVFRLVCFNLLLCFI